MTGSELLDELVEEVAMAMHAGYCNRPGEPIASPWASVWHKDDYRRSARAVLALFLGTLREELADTECPSCCLKDRVLNALAERCAGQAALLSARAARKRECTVAGFVEI